jgi:two-component system chemotaxis response regulator CheB
VIKVLVVDDSAFMRNALVSMLNSDPDIKVIGIARDGFEAVSMTVSLKPDIVTLDVEMPNMDGIEALKRIMAQNPVPVLMVSSLTTEGANATLEALDLGAIDFIPKDLDDLSVNIVKIKEILLEKIKIIGAKRFIPTPRIVSAAPLEMPEPSQRISQKKTSVVAIGSSTGGPKALQTLLSKIPENFPVPILIAQHMPANFTGPFAERLNKLSAMHVKEAEHGEPIIKGTAYIAPGRGHMGVLRKKITETVISISENINTYIYRPSVDALILSILESYSGRVLGVILTGLGNDGAKGMKEIKNKGGSTVVENEDSCIVYGMPKAVVQAGNADKILHIDDIAGVIINTV